MKEFQRIIICIYTREKMCTRVTSDTPLRDVPEQGCISAQDWYQIYLMTSNKLYFIHSGDIPKQGCVCAQDWYQIY